MLITRSFLSLLGLLLLFSACTQEAPDPQAVAEDQSDQSPQADEPVSDDHYRTLHSQKAVTLVTEDEFHYRTEGGATLTGTYTLRGDDEIRAVIDHLGNEQILYYRFTPDGLVDDEGTVFYKPGRYEEEIKAVRAAEEIEALTQGLLEAAEHGQNKLITKRANAGGNVDVRHEDGWTLLQLAVMSGDPEAVAAVLSVDEDPFVKDPPRGISALHLAAAPEMAPFNWRRARSEDYARILKLLLDADPNLNIQDESGKTALMWAIEKGHNEAATQIVFAGADRGLKNHFGRTVFDIANPVQRRALRTQEEIDAEEERFYEQGEVMADAETGLTWLLSPTRTEWDKFQEVCPTLEAEGLKNWRLPTRAEVQTLLNEYKDLHNQKLEKKLNEVALQNPGRPLALVTADMEGENVVWIYHLGLEDFRTKDLTESYASNVPVVVAVRQTAL